MPLVTVQGPTDHMARPTTHLLVGFGTVLILTRETGGLAAVFGIMIVLFEALLTEITCAEKPCDVCDGVEMTDTFVVHQVKVEKRPVCVLVVRDPNEFFTQGRRHDSDSNSERCFKSRKIAQRSWSVCRHTGFLAKEEGQLFLFIAILVFDITKTGFGDSAMLDQNFLVDEILPLVFKCPPVLIGN